MYRRGFLFRAFLALLAIGLLLTMARGVGRFNWWRGYRMGQWSVQEGREETPFRDPPGPHGLRGFGHWPRVGLFSALCGVGLLIKLGLILLAVALVNLDDRLEALLHARAQLLEPR